MMCKFCGQAETPSNPMFQLACARPVNGRPDGPLEEHFNVQVCKRCGGEAVLDAAMEAHQKVCEFNMKTRLGDKDLRDLKDKAELSWWRGAFSCRFVAGQRPPPAVAGAMETKGFNPVDLPKPFSPLLGRRFMLVEVDPTSIRKAATKKPARR